MITSYSCNHVTSSDACSLHCFCRTTTLQKYDIANQFKLLCAIDTEEERHMAIGLMCSHVLPTPGTKGDILYMYICREREKGYREEERYRDEYCEKGRITSYSCNHVTQYGGIMLHDCRNKI